MTLVFVHLYLNGLYLGSLGHCSEMYLNTQLKQQQLNRSKKNKQNKIPTQQNSPPKPRENAVSVFFLV